MLRQIQDQLPIGSLAVLVWLVEWLWLAESLESRDLVFRWSIGNRMEVYLH